MIKVTMGPGGGSLRFNATVGGLSIYLDNFALINLAKHDPARRQRLLAAFRSGVADLLFSVTNAAELVGPQGRSLDAVRTFLDEIGPHWFPVPLNPFEVVEREMSGATHPESCISQQFMKDYFAHLTRAYSPGSGQVLVLSSDFFRLGPVLDWVGPQRDSILADKAKMDAVLIKKVSEEQAQFKRDPAWLDRQYPEFKPFNPSKPGTFTYFNLRRDLIVNREYALKKNDGFDFCHAVVASSFSSFATLDKQWKDRIERLPTPNKLARIYYDPQLDEMVSHIESAFAQITRAESCGVLPVNVSLANQSDF